MSPSEIKMTVKASVIISFISFVFAGGIAWATAQAKTEILRTRMDTIEVGACDRETRLRLIETAIVSDVASIQADQRWIVVILDQQRKVLEDIQLVLGEVLRDNSR